MGICVCGVYVHTFNSYLSRTSWGTSAEMSRRGLPIPRRMPVPLVSEDMVNFNRLMVVAVCVFVWYVNVSEGERTKRIISG